MPSKSAKQARTMRAAAHNPKFAKKMGIPKGVAEEYESADEERGEYGSKKKGKRGGCSGMHENCSYE